MSNHVYQCLTIVVVMTLHHRVKESQMQNDTIYGDLLLPVVLAVVTYRGASSANRVRVELCQFLT